MSKLERIREFLSDYSADWLLITDPVESRYITGISSSNMILCISKTEQHLCTDFRYKEMASSFCTTHDWTFHDLAKKDELIASIIPQGTVAFQSDTLSVDQFEQLEKALPSITFLRLGKEIASLFSAKDPEEIASIQAAAAIADKAFSRWIKEIRRGATEREMADLLEQFCRELGSRGPSFETIVLFGPRAALPHGRPSEHSALSEGDTILVDFGCTVNGFCSDMTRTIFFGEPRPEILERYAITLRAQKAGVAAVRPGISAADVDKIVRDCIIEAGYGENFGHGTGHGVGLRIHEHPALNSRDTTTLRPGMVVTVEPGIYVAGESGVRIEDLLVVTETGCRVLSQSPKELIILSVE